MRTHETDRILAAPEPVGERRDPEHRRLWRHGPWRMSLRNDWCLVLSDGTGRSYVAHVYSPEWRPYRATYGAVTVPPDVAEWVRASHAAAVRLADEVASAC